MHCLYFYIIEYSKFTYPQSVLSRRWLVKEFDSRLTLQCRIYREDFIDSL